MTVMWRILSPNTEYNGITAGVTFVGGVGETDSDPSDYFQRHGYQVEALEVEALEADAAAAEADEKPAKKKTTAKDGK
ncbi:hypothetical protein DW139_07185 [Bifidobacterium adolescentis]|uniref:Uncharacterized protein n=2 Tax=Bifidobacterium adolescentis TaxID=1680 RepID=A0AAX1TXD2_BIFAD|nr:hypothetical protein DW147_05590 [Bifidobacterium adolescentis]RHJ17222.1 hypothetical protein DW139_07185 [Bifidobacterium adolescentis]